MKRELIQDLISWKNSPTRKPLILNGARQVGKTHLLLEFGRNHFQEVHHFNFESSPVLLECFRGALTPENVLAKLEIVEERKIDAESSLVIFDEIQRCPEALTSLKYFCEDAPEFHIACAGSSLGITLAGGTSFPVGKVNFLNLYPLSFSEYLSALGKENLLVHLRSIDLAARDLADSTVAFHAALLEHFFEYIYLGGMPEVVASYAASRDFARAREIQREILRSYDQDFSKYLIPAETLKTRRIWESIPAQLARENKKFIFSAIAKSARAREYEIALQALADAGLILRANLASQGVSPLAAVSAPDSFKVYLLDSGLLGAMVDMSPQVLLKAGEILGQFKGALFEDIVAQSLTAQFSKPLYYWSSGSQAEVDFLLEREGKVFPIEVKSGESLRSKSLHSYVKRYAPDIAFRVSSRPLAQNGKIVELPVYLVGELGRMIARYGS